MQKHEAVTSRCKKSARIWSCGATLCNARPIVTWFPARCSCLHARLGAKEGTAAVWLTPGCLEGTLLQTERKIRKALPPRKARITSAPSCPPRNPSACHERKARNARASLSPKLFVLQEILRPLQHTARRAAQCPAHQAFAHSRPTSFTRAPKLQRYVAHTTYSTLRRRNRRRPLSEARSLILSERSRSSKRRRCPERFTRNQSFPEEP